MEREENQTTVDTHNHFTPRCHVVCHTVSRLISLVYKL